DGIGRPGYRDIKRLLHCISCLYCTNIMIFTAAIAFSVKGIRREALPPLFPTLSQRPRSPTNFSFVFIRKLVTFAVGKSSTTISHWLLQVGNKARVFG